VLPELAAHIDGPSHLSTAVLTAIHEGRLAPAFAMGAPRASHYRITVFTAGGYIAAVLPNEAPPAVDGGRVALRSWLQAETTPLAYVVTDLVVPAALDLSLELPVWIEAGSLSARGGGSAAPEFVATHAARELLWLRLDREFAAFMGR
jgi:hypothetical protein